MILCVGGWVGGWVGVCVFVLLSPVYVYTCILDFIKFIK